MNALRSARAPFVLALLLTLVGMFSTADVAWASTPRDLHIITPCRIYDSRLPTASPSGPLVESVVHTVNLPSPDRCSVPTDAVSIVVNATIVDPPSDGYLLVYQGGSTLPTPPPGAIAFQKSDILGQFLVVLLGPNPTELSVRAEMGAPDGQTFHVVIDVLAYNGSGAPSDIALDNNTVLESQPINTLVGTLSTIDPDLGDTHTYTLVSGTGDTDNGSFTISGNELRTNAILDREGQTPIGEFKIRVRSSDNFGVFFEKELTVIASNVNDAPAGTDKTVGTSENTDYTFSAADFGFTDVDVPANAFQAVVITTLPAVGTLELSNVAVTAGQSVAVADIPNLTFTPGTNQNGEPYASFTFQVQDDGGTANGGIDLDATPNTLSINVGGVNNEPAGTDNTVSLNEDGTRAFTAADFGFTDPSDTPANALQAVTITTLPAVGTLTLSGSPVTAGQSIPAGSLGNLVFTPVANANGAAYASFTFQVQDDGGTVGGGVDLDQTPNTLTLDVLSVNDAPAGTNNAVAVQEDTLYSFTAADFGFTDPIDSPANTLQSVVITTLPGVGSLTLSGAPFAAGTEITVADITAGNLKFLTAANASGSPYTTFTFQVRDNGGTANGGIDLDASANTITVNVTANNDAPVGTDNAVTTPEETQYTFSAADFGFTDPNDSPANNFQSVVITTLPGVGSLTLSGAPFAAGTEITVADLTAGNLKFAPAANASGSPYTTFTFQVRDDGGTANGGVDLDASANTMTVNVTGVNDAPAGTDGAVAAFEDTQYTFAAANFGFTDPNDSPANSLASVVITTLPAAGTLTLSGAPFAAGTEIALADLTAGNLKFQAAANAAGSPYTSFTFQVRDNGGTASGGVDLDASPNTLTVNVTAVNDAPAGTDGAVAAFEDAQYTFAAGDFGFTDPNDSPANSLASVVITSLPGAGSLTLSGAPFAAGTEISLANISGGNLRFTPAANAAGSPYASFTFQVRDNGGTTNGGIDLDASANTLTVNVTAVNDAPAGTNNAVVTFEESQYTFTATDFGFTDPNDSPANSLASVVITTLPGAGSLTLSGSPFAAGTEIPVASITAGNLKFTPTANTSGSPYTTFTFQVRDDGGTANGGVDLDASANTMTVNVTAINDAPAGTDSAVAAFEDTQFTFAAANFGFTDPNDSPANSFASVVITTLPGAGSLTLSGSPFGAGTEISVADITAGNLKFSPAANATGSPYTSFTFQVRDNGGTANGGVDLDASPNTLTINVTEVNDAPAGTDNAVTHDEDTQYTFTAASFGFTDPNDSPANSLASVVITSLPSAGTLTLSGSPFGSGTEISLANLTAGNLKFTPVANAFGTPYTSFTFQVRDNGGTANGGVDLDPTPNTMTINVNPVNDPPVAGTDNFETFGNTELRINLDDSGVTTPHVAIDLGGNPGVRNNDSDPVEGTAVKVTGVVGCTDLNGTIFGDDAICATSGGGQVILEEDGRFRYTPPQANPAQPLSVTSDSFQYTIVDTDATPITATGIVNLTLREVFWYIDPTAAGGGDGRSHSPFQSFGALNGVGGAGDLDNADDYILVHDGSFNGSIELEAGQRLLGQGVAFSHPLGSLGTFDILSQTTQPQVTNAAGDVIKITSAIPTRIAGLSLQGNVNAIDMQATGAYSGSGTLTIDSNTFRGAGVEGIDFDGGATGTLNLNIQNNSWNVAGVHGGNAVDLAVTNGVVRLDLSNNSNVLSTGGSGIVAGASGAGALTITGFANNTVHQNTLGAGISIANALFDATPGGAVNRVYAGNTRIGSGAPLDGVGGAGLSLINVTGDLAFGDTLTSGDLDIYSAQAALTATSTVVGVPQFRLSVTPTDNGGTSTLVSTAGAAVDIDAVTADLRLSGLSSSGGLKGVSLVRLLPGSPAASFPAIFHAPSGSSINTSNAAATAFRVDQSNAAVTYQGAITTTAGRGVDLTSNTGSTIGFSGTLALTSGNSPAFTATGGGTVTATDTASTLTTTTATALNVVNTTIGSDGLRFQRISANGAASGIVLNNTGSSGNLSVLGTGAADSGGIIQNTTSHGVSLTSTLSPSFTRMRIQSTAGSGIKGTQVTNFTFTNGTVDNSATAGGADESNIAFNTALSGTESNVSGIVTITGNSLTNSFWHGVDIQNFNGTLSDLNLSSNTLTSSTSTASSKGAAIRLQAFGSASTAATVTKATISNNVISNFPSGAGILAQGGNSNASGPAGTFGTPGSGTNVISITGNRIAGASSANRMGTSGITGTCNGKGQCNFDISSNGTLANPLTNMAGTAIGCAGSGNTTSTFTVSNNVIVANNTVASNGIGGGTGTTFGTSDTPNMTWTITNNNVSATDGNGILAVARGATGTLNLKIQNNTVAAPLSGVRQGIRVDAGNAASVDDRVCLNISGNTTAGSGSTSGIGLRKQGTTSTTNDFAVNGMAATSTPGVEQFVGNGGGLNPGTANGAGDGSINGVLLISAGSGFSSCSLP